MYVCIFNYLFIYSLMYLFIYAIPSMKTISSIIKQW